MSQLKQAARSPLFFREIVEIERVLLLMAVILIFRCTEGAGVGEGLDSVQLQKRDRKLRAWVAHF